MSPFPSLVAVACAYEVTAILARHHRLPTISNICARRPALIPLILGGLAIHLVRPVLHARLVVDVTA